jgi:hypothetical protein
VPVYYAVRGGVPGKPCRNAAGNRHYVHIGIAIIGSGESQLFSIRRKTGKGFFAGG